MTTTTSTEKPISTMSSGQKQYYTTPNPFEIKFGYHRAVRKGVFIFVSGTTALKLHHEIGWENDDNNHDNNNNENNDNDNENNNVKKKEIKTESKVHYPQDAKRQASLVMERCMDAVKNLGGKREDVVRVKMFVAKHEDCLAVGEAYRESFGSRMEQASEVNLEKSSTISQSTAQNKKQGSRVEEKQEREDVGAAATMIVVGPNGFVDPDILVEIELDAVVA